jgi:hypothetical protein
MESSKKLKPSKLFYLFGSLIIVAAIIASVAVALGAATEAYNSSKQAQVPGSTTLSFDKTGIYSIAYAYDTSSGAKTLITDYSKYAGLKFTLTQGQSGKNVPVTSAGNNMMQFNITQSGTYKFSAAYAGASSPTAIMFITPSGSLQTSIISIIFYFGFGVGLVIIIVTAILRRRNRKKASMS